MQIKLNFEQSPQGRNPSEGYKAPEAVLTTANVLGNIYFTIQKLAPMGRNDYEIPTLTKLANDLETGKITPEEAEKSRAKIEQAKFDYDYN